MTSRAPYWVHKREQALSSMAHMDYERRLQDRIRQLEKKKSELKEKNAKWENAFFVTMDLLMKKL